MNYEELLDTLKTLITAHPFVETFGYGDISDISFPDNEDAPNYIYAFINPVDVSIEARQFSFSCNLIVMEQVEDDEDSEIEGQSLCIQIIQDITSQLYKRVEDGYELLDINFPFTITPFKERFQDNVVGATAGLTIAYGKPLDGCETPYSVE